MQTFQYGVDSNGQTDDETETDFKIQCCLIVNKTSHLDGYTNETDQQETEYFRKVWITVTVHMKITTVVVNNDRWC